MRIDPQELFTPPRAWFTLALFVITQLKQLASVQQKATEDAVKQLEEALRQRARDGFGFA